MSGAGRRTAQGARVLIRADSAPAIGSGHVMRCLTLAGELRHLGADCHFVCRDFEGNGAGRIRAAGFSCTLVALGEGKGEPSMEDYRSWAGGSETEDAETFCAIAADQGCDLAVVDHFGLGAAWEERVRKAIGRVFVIDDLLRDHDCDVLSDPTLGRQAAEYRGKGAASALCGTSYALLRAEFSQARAALLANRSQERRDRLLISMGGSDPLGVTLEIVEAIRDGGLPVRRPIDIVLPEASPCHGEVAAIAGSIGAVLHDHVTDMAGLMAGAGIAIGASGGTAWERCAMGLPALIIPFADNQRGNAHALEAAGITLTVEPAQIGTKLVAALARLEEEREERARLAFLACDGLGARRIGQELFPERLADGMPVTLRPAGAEDAERVLAWQHEPGARSFARNPEPPARDAHLAWMAARLRDPACAFHIIEAGGEAAGFLRLDQPVNESGGEGREVSVLIAHAFRGRGAGLAALSALQVLHRDEVILATVLPQNTASRRLFARAGFKQLDETQWRWDGGGA